LFNAIKYINGGHFVSEDMELDGNEIMRGHLTKADEEKCLFRELNFVQKVGSNF